MRFFRDPGDFSTMETRDLAFPLFLDRKIMISGPESENLEKIPKSESEKKPKLRDRDLKISRET